MRAILRDRYGEPDVLRVAEIPRPTPVGDEVLVKVEAASLNTADMEHLRGHPRVARVGTGLGRPKSPRMGLDVAGRVEAVGPEAERLAPGDEVWADLFGFGHGSFADYVCAPERAFTAKPAGVSFEEAATIPHSGLLALQAIDVRGVRSGDEVLVNGAGGCVGPLAIQIAKARGAVVTGVDHPDKLGLLRTAGADRVVDYTRTDVTRHRGRYDLVVDIAATQSPIRFRRTLKEKGRYVLIARGLGGFLQAAALGALTSPLGSRRVGVFGWVPNRRSDLETLGRMIGAGEVRPIIDRRYPLEEVPDALRHLTDGAASGKLMIIPDQTERTDRSKT